MAAWYFVALFVIINIIQTWTLISKKLLKKGALIVGSMELIEAPLMIYLFTQDGVVTFLIIILTEIIQWSVVAYFTIRR